MTFRESGHVPDRPQPVSIVKTPPASWTSYYVWGVILVVAVLVAVILIAMGNGAGVVVAIAAVFIAAGWGPGLYRLRKGIGGPLLSVGPAGVWCPAFELPWDRVLALDFKDATTMYLPKDPQRTQATRNTLPSLVVTSTERDANGRPVQYGVTLTGHHTGSYDEIRAAARAFSPSVQFWTVIAASDYAVDAGRINDLLARINAGADVDVVNRRGKRRATINANGISAEKATLYWADTAAVVAYTFVHTTSSNYGNSTNRSPRMMFLLHKKDKDGKAERFRFNRSWDYLDYPRDYSPTVEELAVLLRSIAPHIQFADQRTAER